MTQAPPLRPGSRNDGRTRGFSARVLVLLVATTTIAIAVSLLASFVAAERLSARNIEYTLSRGAAALARTASGMGSSPPDPQAFCAAVASGSELRVTIVDSAGAVVGDSAADPAAMENHAARPEIRAALKGGNGSDRRVSNTTGKAFYYAAAPLPGSSPAAPPRGALRVALYVPELGARVEAFTRSAVLGFLVVLALSLFASVRLGRRIAEPVDRLVRAAAAWSGGDFSVRAHVGSGHELEGLARAMNDMASELSERMLDTERRKAELEAILDGMGEALVAMDGQRIITRMNPEAGKMLGPGIGKPFIAAIRSTEADALAALAFSSGTTQEAELELYGERLRTCFAKAAPLSDRSGVVFVLADITRIKRLESVRSDFVANVSHELRTPVTLIKGFAETLKEVKDPGEASRFVSIIERNADRMSAIIDDLLSLASVERSESEGIRKTPVKAADVIAEAVSALKGKMDEKGIAIAIDAAEGIELMANGGLLEQAILNLADNAVKYSPSGSTVRILASNVAGGVAFTVKDEGPGIPAKDIPRIFERFYRVDKGRGRDSGGTGLGLAIVRHIAKAHSGDITVGSVEGKGSSFELFIPSSRP